MDRLIFVFTFLGFDWQRGAQVIQASADMATRPRTKRGAKGGELAAEKENVDVSPVKGLVKSANKLSLEEELEAMTKALKQVSLEKELNEAKLKEKDEQLSAQAAEAERIQSLLKSSDEEKKRLEEKLRKLQKVQGFQPTLVCPTSKCPCVGCIEFIVFVLFTECTGVSLELAPTFWFPV